MFRVHNPGYQKQNKKKNLKKKKNLTKQNRKAASAAGWLQTAAAGQRSRRQRPLSRPRQAHVHGSQCTVRTPPMLVGETAIIPSKAHRRSSWRSKRRVSWASVKYQQKQESWRSCCCSSFFSALYVYLFMQTIYQHFYQYNNTIHSNATSLIGPSPTFLKSCATTISLSSGMQLFNSKDHLLLNRWRVLVFFFLIQSSLGASQGATAMTLSFALSSEPRILVSSPVGSDHGALIHQGLWSQWSRYDPRGASLPYSAKRNQLQRRVDGV